MSEENNYNTNDADQLDDTIFNVENLNIFENDSDDIDALKRKNRDMQNLLVRAIKLLSDKNHEYLNIEKQNKALNIQVGCLKDVVAITKNLLNIRNMEIQDVHSNMASLQEKIDTERQRQTEVIKTVNDASRINEDIKTEYQNQMSLFQQLKEKYNEKVELLTKENQRLQEEVTQLTTLTSE